LVGERRTDPVSDHKDPNPNVAAATDYMRLVATVDLEFVMCLMLGALSMQTIDEYPNSK
jgi:hypothetical protein